MPNPCAHEVIASVNAVSRGRLFDVQCSRMAVNNSGVVRSSASSISTQGV